MITISLAKMEFSNAESLVDFFRAFGEDTFTAVGRLIKSAAEASAKVIEAGTTVGPAAPVESTPKVTRRKKATVEQPDATTEGQVGESSANRPEEAAPQVQQEAWPVEEATADVSVEKLRDMIAKVKATPLSNTGFKMFKAYGKKDITDLSASERNDLFVRLHQLIQQLN